MEVKWEGARAWRQGGGRRLGKAASVLDRATEGGAGQHRWRGEGGSLGVDGGQVGGAPRRRADRRRPRALGDHLQELALLCALLLPQEEGGGAGHQAVASLGRGLPAAARGGR